MFALFGLEVGVKRKRKERKHLKETIIVVLTYLCSHKKGTTAELILLNEKKNIFIYNTDFTSRQQSLQSSFNKFS